MKIWAFIKWHYRKLQIWQKIWILGCMSVGWAIASPSHSQEQYIAGVASAVCMLGVFFKWFVWDPVKDSYEKFKKDQQGLFDTIKNSEKK